MEVPHLHRRRHSKVEPGQMRGKKFCFFITKACALLAVVFVLLLFALRLLGHVLTIGTIRPTSLHHVKYVSKKTFTISASSLRLQLHLPTSKEPYWAKIFVHDGHYDDPRHALTVASLEGTLWFFPVLFRFTSGPLLTVKVYDYRIQVYDSQYTPAWLRLLRDNLVYTIINQETIRLNYFKTRQVSTGLIGMTEGEQDSEGPVEKPGLEAEQDLDEIKMRSEAQQWHIHNINNNRIYTFGALDMEVRKSWVENRSTFVLIAKNSKWTKVSMVGQHPKDTSLLR